MGEAIGVAHVRVPVGVSVGVTSSGQNAYAPTTLPARCLLNGDVAISSTFDGVGAAHRTFSYVISGATPGTSLTWQSQFFETQFDQWLATANNETQIIAVEYKR